MNKMFEEVDYNVYTYEAARQAPLACLVGKYGHKAVYEALKEYLDELHTPEHPNYPARRRISKDMEYVAYVDVWNDGQKIRRV